MLFRKMKLDWRYGISELVIVVLGVLIALGADGLRQERQDRSLEFAYVDGLISDLRADTAELAIHIVAAEERAEHARTVLAVLDTRSIIGTPNDFSRAVEFGSYFSYPTYSRSTIDDLMSTGNLRLIRAKEPKDALSDYHARIEWTEQFAVIIRDSQRALVQVMPDLLGVELRDALVRESMGGPPWAPAQVEVSAEEAELTLERLLARPHVRGLYASMARFQGQHHTNLSEIRELAKDALATLEQHAATGW